MPSATITSKGRVTLPKAIRVALGVGTGDRLDFSLEQGGKVVVRARTKDVRELKGLLKRPSQRPVTLEQMNREIVRQGRRS